MRWRFRAGWHGRCWPIDRLSIRRNFAEFYRESMVGFGQKSKFGVPPDQKRPYQ